MPTQVCRACGREGVKNFTDGVCSGVSANACLERQEVARMAVGLHRIEREGRNGTYHVYKLDGKRMPGVTTIIKGTVPAPALVDWAARVTAQYAADHLDELWSIRHMGLDKVYAMLEGEPRKVRDSAGARGSQLHLWAEDLVHGKTIDVGDPELLPWVYSVRDFIEDCRPKTVLLESPVAHRGLQYAGTLDGVFDFPELRFPGGQVLPPARRIVDYKSSKRIYSEIALQLAGYRGAEFYSDGKGGPEVPLSELGISETGLAVHIRPAGYEILPVYCGPDAFQAYARLTWVYRLLRQGGDLDSWLGDPLPAMTSGRIDA
jgi:hypothetical protein